jgi:hypothetical protein
MSISYQSKDSAVLGLQLKVQELCVKLGDQIVEVSGPGTTVAIDVKESLAEVRVALHCDDSAPAAELIAQSAIVLNAGLTGVAGSAPGKVRLTLGAALAAEDAIVLKYVVAE